VTDPPPELALDSFTRDVTNGLGTAEVGGPWTLSAAASGYSVAGGVGRINGAVAANRAAYLQAVSQTNVDLRTDVALSTAPNGGGAYVNVIGRRVSNGNDYRVKLRYMGNGTLVAYLARTVGGVETILATANVPGITAGAGDQFRIRFQVAGTGTATLRAKVWRVGSAEPGTWLATTTDGTSGLQGPGGLGYLLYVSGTWAGAAPVLSVDNLSVVVP
jgi:hypothetical protein